MEIVLAAVVAAAVAGIVVLAGQRRGPAAAAAGGQRVRSDASLVQATATAPAEAPAPTGPGQTSAALTAVPPASSAATDAELQARRAELARIEERLLSKEEAL